MRAPVQRAVAFAVLVFAANALFARPPVDPPASPESDRVFCDRVLNVLLSVNLRRTGNGLNVVVLAMRPQLAEAERIASRLASESRRRGLELSATSWDLSKNEPVPLNTAAAILLEVPPPARQRVMLAARVRNFLTIGRGPQDLDEVGVVLLPSGDSYRNDPELGRQKLAISREMQSVLQPVSVYTTRKEELARAEMKRQEELARKAKAELAQAHAAYRRGRKRQLLRPVLWPEVAKELRSAIALQPKESVSLVWLGISTINEPYLPHFYLGEALAQIGDCDGAARELRQSEAATRRELDADIAVRVINAVEQCGKAQPPATPRGGK